MASKVIMPQLGESVVEGTVSKWLKQVGDPVNEFEPLLEVSTDKVDTEIPASASGVLLQIYVPEGQTVERGVLLAMIGQPGEAIPDAPATMSTAGQTGQNVLDMREKITQPAYENGERQAEPSRRYSPVVARMAAEHQLDLTRIQGTGLGGRVTKKDVEAYLTAQPGAQQGQQAQPAGEKNAEVPAWEQPISGDLFKPTTDVFERASGKTARPSVSPARVPSVPPPSPELPGELVPLNAKRRAIAEHMVRSKLLTAPHVTTVFEVNMSRVMAHWKANMDPYAAQGLRLTLTAYFVFAVVKAVQAQPTLNSRWVEGTAGMGGGLFMHHTVNVGMAVALPDGLIVPVIKNAQDLSLSGLARRVTDLAARARSKGLTPDDVTGGTITLTNHGVSGSLFATPIINQPQSAIVGVGMVQKRVIVIDEDTDAIAVRPMMYATLTFDHRVADGAVGDAFLSTFKQTLETWT